MAGTTFAAVAARPAMTMRSVVTANRGPGSAVHRLALSRFALHRIRDKAYFAFSYG